MKVGARVIFACAFIGEMLAPSLAAASKPSGSSFETTIEIKRKKADLVICSEGAATGEQLDAALNSCDLAIQQSPENGDAYYYRGYVYFHLQRLKEAEADFTTAIALKSSREAESYYQRGVCKERQRRLREAAKDFKSAAAIKPEWYLARRKVEEYHWAYE